MQDIQTTFGVISVDSQYTALHEAIDTQENYIHSDFLVAVNDRTSYDIKHEIQQLLLSHYYTADVTVAVHEKYNEVYIVWYTAQGRI